MRYGANSRQLTCCSLNCKTRPDSCSIAEAIPAADCGIGPASLYKYLITLRDGGVRHVPVGPFAVKACEDNNLNLMRLSALSLSTASSKAHRAIGSRKERGGIFLQSTQAAGAMNKQNLGKERSKQRRRRKESSRLPTASIHRANLVFSIPAPQQLGAKPRPLGCVSRLSGARPICTSSR